MIDCANGVLSYANTDSGIVLGNNNSCIYMDNRRMATEWKLASFPGRSVSN